MISNKISRRDFIRGTALAGAAAVVGMPIDSPWAEEPVSKAKVVLVRDAGILSESGKVNPDVAADLLDKAVMALFEKDNAIDAWKQVVLPQDIVGIKTNVWRPLPTPSELEQAIKNRVLEIGVPEENLAIADRGILENPIFQKSTALINIRPIRTHSWAGIGGCIKNYIMFVPRPDAYHSDSCADLATIWQLPHVKGRTRLNILVLLTPLFYGLGPHHFDRKYVWEYKGILAGTDPVAVDSTGLRILEAKRLEYFGEYRPMTPPAHHVKLADTRHGLGISDPKRIELVKLGWQDGILI